MPTKKAPDGIYPYEVKKGRNQRERQRYRVVYTKPDGRQTSKRGFTTKSEADLFLSNVRVTKAKGEYIDPKKLRTTVADLAGPWLETKRVTKKPSTYQTYVSRWRVHVGPRWGRVPVGKVTRDAVQIWVNDLSTGDLDADPPVAGKSPSLIADCHAILVGILDTADVPNPVKGRVELPRREKSAHPYLSHEQVRALAELSAWPEIIYTLAYTGLRWGELAGLRVRNVDLPKRRVSVERAITQLRDGSFHEGPPKSWERRSVPVPGLLVEVLAGQCARKGPDDFVFMSPNGGHVKPPSSQTGWFAVALRKSGLPSMRVHDLRHTTASLALSAGANVKVLQRMMGHKDAATLLNIYSDLFEDDLGKVADALDMAAGFKQ